MNKKGELEGYNVETTHDFMFKIRTDADGTTLKSRPGCDAVGYYTTSGSMNGNSIEMVMEYDIDGDDTTKEPKLVLTGEWGGEEDKWTIKGSWKNENADAAGAQMSWIGLEGVQEGTFVLKKRIRDDEA